MATKCFQFPPTFPILVFGHGDLNIHSRPSIARQDWRVPGQRLQQAVATKRFQFLRFYPGGLHFTDNHFTDTSFHRQLFRRQFISPTVHFTDNYFADSHFVDSHFADNHFADNHFTDSSLHRQFNSPTVHFTDSSFRRQHSSFTNW